MKENGGEAYIEGRRDKWIEETAEMRRQKRKERNEGREKDGRNAQIEGGRE